MNITIYIRKEVEEQFKAEEKKSELINKLLTDYYKGYETLTTVRSVAAEKAVKIMDDLELAKLTFGEEPFPSDCKHEDVNKRNGICNVCGEYTR